MAQPHADHKTVRITIESGPDGMNRQTFCAEWICPSWQRKRGQYFKAVVSEHVASWRRDGWDVDVTGEYVA